MRSYPIEGGYIDSMEQGIADFFHTHSLREKEVVLFFSAHGLPQSFVDEGDPYERECYLSFDAIRQRFPESHSILAFQSRFGRGKWLKPYTDELCANPQMWNQGRKNVLFIPLSFTSDHIETLFEIEYQYLPLIRKGGLNGFRCPTIQGREDWMRGILKILEKSTLFSNEQLIRKKNNF